ncbi:MULTISPECIES: hypothetical protein [Sutcliffiella]|uniref:Uncharacterized protein n=1 Tax=Sutcliffiella cohnii TaxID=33932 RepID=A0A223KNV5_9BACI|nr:MULTISPECIES: hypothetical protein [Sutcliffiella]AST91195.1 hypothetical protein BC6307_07840 [Sutcliffiella cohnii]WBL17009.1 hypothetical protein O1A01_10410 [Sutcliffiella sp. NC1]
MDHDNRIIALKTLNYLCKGSVIEGLLFHGLRILLSENEYNEQRIEGQISINIESEFEIFQSLPEKDPKSDELHKLDWVESAKKLCELRLKKIVDIKLGEQRPHLYFIFDSGEVLFINGHHQEFESWQVEVHNNTNLEDVFQVVACPGDNLVTWVPEDVLE